MLPTNEKASYPKYTILCLDLYDLEKPRKLVIIPKMLTSLQHKMMPQHLYILSDEEIKEGDWYLDRDGFYPKKVKKLNDGLIFQ